MKKLKIRIRSNEITSKDGKIDIEQTKVMVDKFLDAGFTYFDTAWAYAGSEDAIRQELEKVAEKLK